MRIVSKVFAVVTAALLSGISSDTTSKATKEGPPPITKPLPEKPIQIPHPFLLAQLPPAENKSAVQVQEPALNYLITKGHRERAQSFPDSLFAFEIVQSPAYTVTEKDVEIALNDENSWFAEGIGKNTTTHPLLFKKLLERALEKRDSKLAFGVFQNQNEALFKVTKKLKEEYIDKAKQLSVAVHENEAVIAMHKTWEFTDVERKLAVTSSSSYFKYYAAQNPSFFRGLDKKQAEEYKHFARLNKEIWFSEGLAQNDGYEFTEEDLTALRRQLQSWYTHGAGRNKNYPWGPVDEELMLLNQGSYLEMGRTRSPYYKGVYSYYHSSRDLQSAKEFSRTYLAYRFNIDPKSPISGESTEFARKSYLNANSAYAIAQVRNPKFRIGDTEIKWILENGLNANTEFAYEAGLKLSAEQIRKYFDVTINQKPDKINIQEAVRGYLIDTLFAEAVSKNPNFAGVDQLNGGREISEIDKQIIRGGKQPAGRASYGFTKLAAGLIQNLHYGIIEPADIETAQKEFIRSSDFAYHLAKKLNEKQIQSIKDLDNFIIKNPKSKLVLGLFNNECYSPSDKAIKFLLENSKSDFIRELAKSKAFKITPEIKKLVMQNPDSKLAYGAAQNENWGIVSPEEKLWIFEKGNHDTLAARGLLMNTKCYKMGSTEIEKRFLKKDEKNLNTMAADLIGAHPDFPFDYESTKIAREKPTNFTRGVRANPQANATALYIPERERR